MIKLIAVYPPFILVAGFTHARSNYSTFVIQTQLIRGDSVPQKPKRPCSYPGCPKLTEGRFCEEHAKLEAKRYEKYDRSPTIHRRYGRAWKRIRDRFISTHPLCQKCYDQGVLTKAEEVHHILPLSQGGTHAEENLMALCKSCHSRITAEMGDRWGKSK